MLLSMTLANFKSVKNPQTISFVALNDKRLDLTKTVQGTEKFNILKTSAIIGPNGAGKSSFVRALEAVKGIVFAPEEVENPLRRYLSKAAFAYGDGKTRPSVISMDILLDRGVPGDDEKPSVIARYTIKATQDAFYEESLYYIMNGSKKIMFERKWTDSGYVYRFGKYYRGEKKRLVSKLADDRSFLQGAALKGGQTALEVYSWLEKNLNVLPLGYGAGAERVIVESLKTHPERSDQIVSFLWALDITDIFRLQVIRNDKGMETVGISHCFVNAKGTEAYGQTFMNESLSLRRLILIAVSFFEAFSSEKTIVIDDFGQLLHPYVLTHIMEIFHTNDTQSQLIVVDCNPALLQKDLMRKDAIWFAEKGEESSTVYTSLADYKGMKAKQGIYEGYLQGVFGALPIESDFYFQNKTKENN